jgi:hypothetical protein
VSRYRAYRIAPRRGARRRPGHRTRLGAAAPMTWFITIALCTALGWHARGPIASAWWRGQATIAEARVTALEGELAASRQTLATAQGVYLARLTRCEGCATCNPEPQGFGLPDYEFGDRP